MCELIKDFSSIEMENLIYNMIIIEVRKLYTTTISTITINTTNTTNIFSILQ